jgi:hypothetical protein
MGMYADRTIDTFILFSYVNTLQCAFEVGSDRNKRFDAGCPGTGKDLFAILVKLFHLDVTVSIDQGQ